MPRRQPRTTLFEKGRLTFAPRLTAYDRTRCIRVTDKREVKREREGEGEGEGEREHEERQRRRDREGQPGRRGREGESETSREREGGRVRE